MEPSQPKDRDYPQQTEQAGVSDGHVMTAFHPNALNCMNSNEKWRNPDKGVCIGCISGVGQHPKVQEVTFVIT